MPRPRKQCRSLRCSARFPVWAVLLGVLTCPAGAAPTEIWLAPIEPFSLYDRNPGATADFLEMFEPKAPWDNAAAHIAVVKNATKFVLYASDSMLKQVLDGLSERHIAYAVETSLLPSSSKCGTGIEGFMNPGGDLEIARKIRRLGGSLSFLAMDEPLWYGHYYSGPGACKYTVDDVAQQIARELRLLRQMFPQLRVGDIEPVGTPQPKDWLDEISRWAAAYHAATGESLSFLHADVDWVDEWRSQLGLLRDRLHAEGVPLGIIFLGKPADATAEAATRHAEQRMAEVDADPHLEPDQVIIQSWLREPTHNLPESRPGTMTYLVNRYLAANTKISAARSGDAISGLLTDSADRPVPGASVELLLLGDGGNRSTVMRHISGSVPNRATSAVLGVRINNECSCAGRADVRVGALRYEEQGSGAAVIRPLGPSAPDGMTQLIADNRQQVMRNSQPFPVVGGANYTVDIPVQELYVAGDAGYLAAIFLDPAGREIKRDVLALASTVHKMDETTTDVSGRYSFVLKPSPLAGDDGTPVTFPRLKVRFRGAQTLRISAAIVP